MKSLPIPLTVLGRRRALCESSLPPRLIQVELRVVAAARLVDEGSPHSMALLDGSQQISRAEGIEEIVVREYVPRHPCAPGNKRNGALLERVERHQAERIVERRHDQGSGVANVRLE